MKRSRRVALTMMGSAAIGAVSLGFAGRECGVAVRTADGRIVCRGTYYGTYYGGFGRTLHHVHGHGHGHAGG